MVKTRILISWMVSPCICSSVLKCVRCYMYPAPSLSYLPNQWWAAHFLTVYNCRLLIKPVSFRCSICLPTTITLLRLLMLVEHYVTYSMRLTTCLPPSQLPHNVWVGSASVMNVRQPFTLSCEKRGEFRCTAVPGRMIEGRWMFVFPREERLVCCLCLSHVDTDRQADVG